MRDEDQSMPYMPWAVAVAVAVPRERKVAAVVDTSAGKMSTLARGRLSTSPPDFGRVRRPEHQGHHRERSTHQ